MSEYWTGLVFRQLALAPFPDSSDFRRCLKSESENPKPNTVNSHKSIWTVRILIRCPKKLSEIQIPFC